MREKQFQGAPKKYKGRNKRHCFSVDITVYEGDVKRTEVFSSLAKARKILRTLPFATLSFCYVKYRKDSWGVKRSWYGISRFGEIAKYHDRRQWLKVLYELNLDKEEIKILEKAAEKMQEYLQQKPHDVIAEFESASEKLVPLEELKCPVCGEKMDDTDINFVNDKPVSAVVGCIKARMLLPNEGGHRYDGYHTLYWDKNAGMFRSHEYKKHKYEYGIRPRTRKKWEK